MDGLPALGAQAAVVLAAGLLLKPFSGHLAPVLAEHLKRRLAARRRQPGRRGARSRRKEM